MNRPASIRVTTPSRLHFGLLSLGEDGQRQFGGAGLMIDRPGVELVATRVADGSSVRAPTESIRARSTRILDSLLDQTPLDGGSLAVDVIRCPREHVGLGTGTQLSLAIARAVACFTGDRSDGEALAARTGRGARSAIGVHGFERGGFLIDGGKRHATALAPLLARADFPDDWPVLLIQPQTESGLHGALEREAFADRISIPVSVTESLALRLFLHILPAVLERDYPTFARGIFEYNRRIGECFAAAQGGAYAHPAIDQLVATLRSWEIGAVGQSSWGPTTFAILDDPDRARWVQRKLANARIVDPATVIVARSDNVGAICDQQDAAEAATRNAIRHA